MELLKGKKINLRPLEPEDLEFLYNAENDGNYWKVSGTQTPFSKYLLKNYIENSHQDIYEAKQLRLIIETSDSRTPVGMIDLFDFEPQHKRAGIGLLILSEYQNQGFASESISMLVSYAHHYLGLHQVFANIGLDNQTSIHLFEKHNFTKTGIKKDWILYNGSYFDEAVYQRILTTKNEQ
ncbi:GNAT family N-acetyltransferase [Flavicella marina]|uniref:GNAT family N-acetyltransferase n=1 Tax=Flavicella marina TaxID=1475951 RepID=UPI001265681C|nr:GNAT family protein [Flavicella marina]